MSYSYTDFYEPIFKDVTASIDTDWKAGLIGRNGRGKTTLLKLIHGSLVPDSGKINKSVNTEMFPYEIETSYVKTIDVLKELAGGFCSMEKELENMEILQRYIEEGGYEVESRIMKELYYMNIFEEVLSRDFALLSGGEQTKILLIALFLRKNAFILLDEPTNHLDITGKEAVAAYLAKKSGFLLVSHDREFIDNVTDHIISINKSDITIEKGNYSTWRFNKDLKEEFEFKARDKLENEIVSLEQRAGKARIWAKSANQQKYAFASNYRTNGSKSYMRQARNSEKKVQENLEEKKLLLKNFEKERSLQLTQGKLREECLVKVNLLTYGYARRKLFEDLSFEIYTGDRIWIRGENGAGKSTLLQIISGRIHNDAISHTGGLKISYASQEALWREGYLNDLSFGQLPEEQERFHALCKAFDLPSDYFKRPLETYSSGELKKIEIAKALSMNNQLLILDEPLNYMDVYFREQLEKAILRYQPTLVFVEHDIRFGENISNVMIEL